MNSSSDGSRAKVYLPLEASKDEIRLVHFHGLHGGPLTAHMEVVSLADPSKVPTFFALSYEWKPPSMEGIPDTPLSLDGYQTIVKANLAAFLTQWLAINAEDDGIYCWIDALCINQDRVSERRAKYASCTRSMEQRCLSFRG